MPQALHLHPSYGVAAFLGTIWFYRQMMVCLPTALLLAFPSALGSGLIAWLFSDGAGLQRFVEKSLSLAKPWASLQALWPVLNGWVIAASVLSLAVHVTYWRYRRRKMKRTDWVFNRSPLETAKELFAMVLFAGAIGWGIAWLWPAAA